MAKTIKTSQAQTNAQRKQVNDADLAQSKFGYSSENEIKSN